MGNCLKNQRRISDKIPTQTKLQDNVPMGKDQPVSKTLRPRQRVAPKLRDLNDNRLYRSRMSTRETASTISNHSFA